MNEEEINLVRQVFEKCAKDAKEAFISAAIRKYEGDRREANLEMIEGKDETFWMFIVDSVRLIIRQKIIDGILAKENGGKEMHSYIGELAENYFDDEIIHRLTLDLAYRKSRWYQLFQKRVELEEREARLREESEDEYEDESE